MLRTRRLRPWRRLILCLALLAPSSGSALPFDLIAPTHVVVNAGGGFGINFGSFGWVSPTSTAITDVDLDNAIVSATLTDPNVGISASSNGFGPFTLTPGVDVGGFVANFPTTDNDILLTELLPGESVTQNWRYAFDLTFPNTSYSGSGVIDASVQIGGHTVNWSTTVDFDPLAPKRIEFFGAQRLTAVPEPGTAALLALGLLGLARCGGRASHR